jgi:tetratricopeptide (TPR) repeat protein
VCDLQTDTGRAVPDSNNSTTVSTRGAGRWAAVIIPFAGALFYFNSLQGSFVFDEQDWIVDNPHIRHLWPPWQALFGGDNASRPLIGLSNAINYAISGLNPWSYHLLNLMIHIIAALALYGIVRRTLLTDRLKARFGKDSSALALVVALIWMVHPLQTQSVTYVIQRCESMMGMFYLVCLYCSIRSYDSARKRLWYAAAVAACVGGMLSKQVMVTAPIIVFLYDVVFNSQSPKEALRKRWPLFAGLAITWFVLAATMIAAPVNLTAGFAVKTISPWGYFKTELGVIVYYLRLSFWPNPLCLDYQGWPVAKTIREALPYAIVIGGLGAATVWALVRRRPEGFLGAWFFLILSITSSAMPFADLVYEHRMYLPLAAVVAFVVLGCYALVDRFKHRIPHIAGGEMGVNLGRTGIAVATLTIAALGFATATRNMDYSSKVAMWSDVVKKRPDNPRAHTHLGKALAESGKTDEAIDQFREALRLVPTLGDAQCSLGAALVSKGDLSEAKDQLLKAISLVPQESSAHYNLGIVFSDMGQTTEAIDEFTRAVAIKPELAEAHVLLGRELEKAGRISDAKQEYGLASQLRPEWAPKLSSHIAALK